MISPSSVTASPLLSCSLPGHWTNGNEPRSVSASASSVPTFFSLSFSLLCFSKAYRSHHPYNATSQLASGLFTQFFRFYSINYTNQSLRGMECTCLRDGDVGSDKYFKFKGRGPVEELRVVTRPRASFFQRPETLLLKTPQSSGRLSSPILGSSDVYRLLGSSPSWSSSPVKCSGFGSH